MFKWREWRGPKGERAIASAKFGTFVDVLFDGAEAYERLPASSIDWRRARTGSVAAFAGLGALPKPCSPRPHTPVTGCRAGSRGINRGRSNSPCCNDRHADPQSRRRSDRASECSRGGFAHGWLKAGHAFLSTMIDHRDDLRLMR
jgi:hypothetical protein